jgi:hypothetical protein
VRASGRVSRTRASIHMLKNLMSGSSSEKQLGKTACPHSVPTTTFNLHCQALVLFFQLTTTAAKYIYLLCLYHTWKTSVPSINKIEEKS